MNTPAEDANKKADLQLAVGLMTQARNYRVNARRESPFKRADSLNQAKLLEEQAMELLGLNHPRAIIYVDGHEMARCFDSEYLSSYESVKREVAEQEPNVQHEYVLMVWSDLHQIYVRRRLEYRV